MLKIYGVPISVHTRKVIAAVLAKGLKYELEVVVPIGPSSLPAKWETISPTGKVPAVEDGDVVIADSSSLSQGTKADRYSARVALPLIRLPPGGTGLLPNQAGPSTQFNEHTLRVWYCAGGPFVVPGGGSAQCFAQKRLHAATDAAPAATTIDETPAKRR